QVPADLETVCLKCLAKEPAKRYASAQELADELGRFLAGEPIRARPIGTVERLGRWCRRHPLLATLAALAGLAVTATLVLSLGFAYYQGQAAESLRREQQQTAEARNRAEGLVRELQETVRQRGRLVLMQGQARCEQGEVAEGLLVLASGLELVSKDDPKL